MKIVIIGSGIAGLAMAKLLQQNGHEVVVNEKQGGLPVKGNAFLMNEEGMQIVKSLAPDKKIPGLLTHTFHRFKPNGRMVSSQRMDDWYCCRRSELILHLASLVQPETILYGRNFSHFLYRGQTIIAVVFQNGEVEYGDVFIGADGSRSAVRQKLFGKTDYSPVEVREILGLAKHPSLAQSRKGVFSKIQAEDKGLSFGFIPVSDDELIWFSQMDVNSADQPPVGAEALKNYMSTLLKDFQEPVHELIDTTDFSTAYVWNTTDFETLSSFHHSNCVLMGDAAHMAVPFTSVGVTNALKDVLVLTSCMQECGNDLESAFQQYYDLRMPVVHEHLLAGRAMKQIFLNPQEEQKVFNLPMVPKQPAMARKQEESNTLEVLYFTDPICSTCWTIQPQLRKLKMEYAGKIEFKYHMSGLLPEWKGFDRHGIKSPADVARHWEEASAVSGMPLDGSIWLEDPLASSFPPSLAFKAAQIQSPEKALEFLRKLNEAVFMEKKNITSRELLVELASEVGMDIVKFLEDMGPQGEALFNIDLKEVESLEITSLPTMVFKLNGSVVGKISELMDYESLHRFIKNLSPLARKTTIDLNARQIFDAYASLTTKEFAYILGLDEIQAEVELIELEKAGKIRRISGQKGALWVNKGRLYAA